MSNLFKALTTTFFVMSAVILSICYMEIADDNLSHTDVMLYGIMTCVGITGCIGAAVGVNTIKDKG